MELWKAIPRDRALTLEGYSVAMWKKYSDGRGFMGVGTGGGLGFPKPNDSGSLLVVTTHLAPAQFAHYGIPQGPQTTLIEFFNRVTLPNGSEWLVLTSIVEDPEYLYEPYMVSTHFKREPDKLKWHPQRCTVQHEDSEN